MNLLDRRGILIASKPQEVSADILFISIWGGGRRSGLVTLRLESEGGRQSWFRWRPGRRRPRLNRALRRARHCASADEAGPMSLKR